jgi:hypothetical protein
MIFTQILPRLLGATLALVIVAGLLHLVSGNKS